MIPAAIAAIIAGGLAAVVRYLISQAFGGRGFLPWAVLTVNLVGSLIGGTAVGLATAGVISTELRLVLLGGVAGGLTTFSTWSVETLQLATRQQWQRAVLNVLVNLVAGLALAVVGYVLGASI
ncbi:MAG: CrcB family protein [Glaciihabitans sp.]|nr:CrcB family protein [Glaciihabitans sp.]